MEEEHRVLIHLQGDFNVVFVGAGNIMFGTGNLGRANLADLT